MKSIICCLYLLLIVECIKNYDTEFQGVLSAVQMTSSTSTSAQAEKQLRELSESHPLGQMAVEFAQLNIQASGAVDTLIDVLKAFGRQLEEKQQEEQNKFDALLGEHTSKVLTLESLVNQAELDINREKKRMTQDLIPRSSELDDILLSLKAKKEQNTEAVNDAKAVRKDQQAAFNMFSNEISEAIRAVDEALDSIKQMMQSGGQAYVEIVQKRIHDVRQRAEGVEALSEISEHQDFAQKQVIKELVDLLNSLRGNFVETLQKAYADEDQQKMLHQQRMDQLSSELSVFDKQYGEAVQEREEKSIMISDTQSMIDTRSIDHQGYESRLKTENNNFSQNQKINDDLMASISEEIGVIEKSIDLLSTPVMKDHLQEAVKKSQ